MIQRLAFVEVVVRDFDAALAWYTKVLGFKLSGAITSNEDGRWCQLVTTEGDDRLALWRPSWTPNLEGKSQPSFIPVFAVHDLRTLVDRLAADQVTLLEGIRERADYRITTIADPEGNRLQLFETTTSA
ncbi:MAG: VOC family protein [Parcubacteria group bacterium]